MILDKGVRLWISCGLVLGSASTGFAVTYTSGSHTISTTLSSSSPPVVTVIGAANVTVTSTGHIEGNGSGTADPALLAGDDASVAIDGGTVNAQGSGADLFQTRAGIQLQGNARLTLQPGSLIQENGSGINLDRAGILAEGNSRVFMHGGLVRAIGSGIDTDYSGILALDTSQIAIFGGNLDVRFPHSGVSADIVARELSLFLIHGSSFNLPYGPVVPLQGTLTGALADGSLIDWSFARDVSAQIILVPVPEPSSSVLLAVGLLALCSLAYRSKCGRAN